MCGYIKEDKRNGNSKREPRCHHRSQLYDDGYDPTVYNLKLPNGVELIDEGDIADDPVPRYNNEDYNYYYDYEFQDTFWDALSLINDKDWKKF